MLIQEWYCVCENYRNTWLKHTVRKYLETFRIGNICRSIPDQTTMYRNLVRKFGYVEVAEEMIRQNTQRRLHI